MSGLASFVIMAAILAFVVCSEREETRIVETEQGKVEGCLSDNELYYEFLGIQYGVPVKFKAPLEPPSFPGIYRATASNILCPQYPSNDLFGAPSDNEDCLFLNIFTPPSFQSNASLPVMVYLHGGDFGVGSGNPSFYGPQYLVSHDVIIITVNYRLNVYGFLNLGIKEAPGNAGLKDIRAALRWVKANIGNFGGDPDNVTVFGQGSGGTAAIYLMMSESTKGLCHRVISQSGTPFSSHSFDTNPVATASQVAKSLEVNTKNPNLLLKTYTDTSIVKVEEAISKQMNAKSVFVPSVEKVFDDEEPFLTDTVYNILSGGPNSKSFNPLPMIIGMNTVEGLTTTLDYNTVTSQMDRIKHDDLSVLDQRSLLVPKDEKEEVRNLLKETYFTNGTDEDEKLLGGIINLNTDFSYLGPMNLFADMLANASVPVYQYIFYYEGNRNLGKLLTNSSLPATTNLDELIYLFELDRLPLPMDEDDARIVTFMTTMWTNFAKFGTPTPDPSNGEWLPHPHNLAILLEPEYVEPLTPERSFFWRVLYYKYGAETIE